MRKAHHFAVAFVRIEDAGAYTPNVFGKRHHQIFAYRVNRRIGYLGELLAEIVEKQLRSVAQNSQGSVVAHCRCRLLAVHAHGNNGVFDVFLAVAEYQFVAHQVVDAVAYLAPAAQFLQLYAVC